MNNFYKETPVRVNPVLINCAEKRLKLRNDWKFRLDHEDIGLKEMWYKKDKIFLNNIIVPGTWQGQGFGNDEKEPFLENQECKLTQFYKATYRGTGWYCTFFNLPDEWMGTQIWLNFGGIHPSADIWLNNEKIGENHEPFVPFSFNVSDIVDFNKQNILIIRVYEKSRVMGLSYNCHGSWSGIYRDVEITSTGTSYIKSFIIYADVDLKKIFIKTEIHTIGVSMYPLTLKVLVRKGKLNIAEVSMQFQIVENEKIFCLPLDSLQLWSPDKPDLYDIDAVLLLKDKILDALSERTGFVKLETKKNHFLINNEPFFMRGTGDFNSSPETGSPDTDRDRWRKKLTVLKEYGYNYVRCQSFVPSPEYFDVADEVGLLVQSEMGILGAWIGYNMWHGYNWPLPNPDYRKALKSQWNNVVLRDVNHPSANIYCMSNELMLTRNKTNFPRLAWQCYRETKAIKNSALITWTDGGYNEEMPQDFVNYYYDKIKDICKKPVIEHEFRWWASYPDIRIKDKYSGAVRPCSIELAFETARRNNIDHLLVKAAVNSQRIQYIQAKCEMENWRRDNIGLAGINHFMAMDLTLSPQGILDEFYERKYADSAKWVQTNGDTVILANLEFGNRVLSAGDTLNIKFYVSDYSHPPLKEPVLHWRLSSEGKILKESQIIYKHKQFTTCNAGYVDIVIPDILLPTKACLDAILSEGKRIFTNSWDLWLFPKIASVFLPADSGVYGTEFYSWINGLKGIKKVNSGNIQLTNDLKVIITEKIDEKLIEFAFSGGCIILIATECLQRHFNLRKEEGYFFNSIVGCKPPLEDNICGNIINNHPIFGNFPHEGFADLQFYHMIINSAPIDIESFGLSNSEPIIRLMHSYLIARPLAYLMEFSLGKGGLIVCSLDMNQSLPEARYLLSQIFRYAISNKFNPVSEISKKSLMSIKEACF